MSAGRVCVPCRLGDHMLQPRDHPWWDGEEPSGREWAPEDRCACECAREPVRRSFVDVHLPPFRND